MIGLNVGKGKKKGFPMPTSYEFTLFLVFKEPSIQLFHAIQTYPEAQSK